MSLEPSYLNYPERKYGQDIDRHDWRLAKDRPRVDLPGGAQVAVMPVLVCEHHPIDPQKAPFSHPHGMKTPFPDLRHYTSRDYGNRVGAFRILHALSERKIRATVAMSAVLVERARPLLDAALEAGCEIAAAGLHGDAIHHAGLSEADERAMIEQTRRAFAGAGVEPVTWLSPARQESFATPDLLVEAGFRHLLDWETDQVPVFMKTRAGRIGALPLHNELDDFRLLIERTQTEDVWARQILEARDYLKAEHERYGAQMLGFTLTGFVAGQPFRMSALEAMLDGLSGDARTITVTASEAAGLFEGLSKDE